MKYLAYTTYCSGGAGLSNGIMSLEIGLILAHLTNRLLILEGNESPPANIVQYPGVISNSYPSKLTDLIHLPHPWCEAQDIDLTQFDSKEWTSHSLGKSVFSHPAGWEVGRKDFQSFAHGRKHLLTYTGDYAAAKVLKMSGGPGVGPHRLKMWNFSFYSYFFYLDTPHQQQMFNLLKRMTPKKPYRDFADRVASDLGPFNAVHIRRGDFKKTYGVTTLDRSPQEALEVLGYHFSRHEKLVILTDEMHDPFFDEIVAFYPDCVFLDQFILDHYREAFLDLPQHDSITLAYLSQLIAGESQDFIGSMNSTFTALIQRFRGNAGRMEPFKFLWNELADESTNIQRGRHAPSRCVPMRHGVMIDQHSGPYSWNRVHPRINPAWMREWPESFIPGIDKTQAEGDARQADVTIVGTQKADLANHQENGIREPENRKLLTIQGEAISKDGKAFVFIGMADENIHQLMKNLQNEGWTHVSAHGVTLDVSSKEVIPQHGGQSDPIPCEALVLNTKAPGPEDQLVPGFPGIAVGTILSHCDRLPNNHESTVRSLCEFVESIPVYRLSVAAGQQALKLVCQAHQIQPVSNASQKNIIGEPKAIERSEPSIISTEATGIIPSPSIQIDNFLSPDEAQRLLAFTLDQESAWEASTVSTDTGTAIKHAPDYRKSVVLRSFKDSEFSELITNRVRARLPDLLRELNIASYSVKEIEAQLTASNDGDFFKIHNDNGFRAGKARELTYVYYFYRYPKRFIGGELVIYDGKIEDNAYARADSYKVIEPRHNSIVFFPSGCLHEVLPIRCPSQAFGDSRFTINGWVQRQKMLPPTGLPDSIKEWAKTLK